MNHDLIKRRKGGTNIPQLEGEEFNEPNPDQMNDDKAMFEFELARGK